MDKSQRKGTIRLFLKIFNERYRRGNYCIYSLARVLSRYKISSKQNRKVITQCELAYIIIALTSNG